MTATIPIKTSQTNHVIDLFREQATHNPDAIALIGVHHQMTYRELDQRTNQLAWHLKKLSIKPETLVGICMSRSLDMIVAIFGVLKSGGAYVPLDPAYPDERLSFILSDAQAPVVITESTFSGTFSGKPVYSICMDTDWDEICKNPVEPALSPMEPENLAYVIYTSGSTGKPKGVMVTHSNLLNFIRISGLALDVTDKDVYLQTASIAYALSVRQIMVPLCAGATLVIATEDVHDPIALFNLIKVMSVSLMDMVPSFWRVCLHRLSDLPAEELSTLMDNSLRRIVSIGEPLLSDLPREWITRFGSKVSLVNIFGQTETTGVVATYPIPPEVPVQTEIVPIGRAVPETQIYLLDSQLQPVPLGEPGELCVSNECIARGYLNSPELTLNKFIHNPFEDGLSNRLYRTGDMARLREDGTIEFLGRGDHQVKIRGQRVELGEIEMNLRDHPSVRECVVTARGDHPDEKYLVAYIVAAPGQLMDHAAYREFMRSKVPFHMVPSVYVVLDAIPLTPNGKIDRLALPDPNQVSTEVARSGSLLDKPRDPVEKSIERIWKKVLKVNHIGIHDDYFDLGGNSFQAVQMFACIERDLGVRLPYTSLFHATTIAQLARLIVNKEKDDGKSSIVIPVRKEGSRPPFYGVHGQDGGVLFWRDLVVYLPADQPFYAVQAQGVDGLHPPLNRIPAMAELYVREIRKVQPKGPYYLGGYSLGGEVAFEMAQQLTRQGERVNLLVLFDTRNPKRSIRLMTENETGSLSPVFESSLDRWESLKRKINGHLFRLSRMTMSSKVDYVKKDINRRIHRLAMMISIQTFHTLQMRIPDNLLQEYVREKHMEALINYIPEKYAGRITLFRATETLPENPTDSLLGWGPLAECGMDVYHFDAPHELMRAQYAREVAVMLNECLLKAQTTEQKGSQ